MRKVTLPAAALALALAVVLGGMPARAGQLTWEDPAGDAAPEGLPIPVSEPSYDVTTVTMASDGTNLVWEASVPELAAEPPPHGTGMHFTFGFMLGENEYSFRIREDRIGGGAQAFYYHAEFLEPQTCDKCKLKLDREAKKVTVNAPIASMARGIRSAGAGDKFGPGTKMESVTVIAGPVYFIGAPGVASLTSFGEYEMAAAPDPGTFTV